jgi:polysaccharide chain length determinant protein (PEP-CTERM system associated)
LKEIDQLRKYLGVALEKKYWVIIPLLLCVLGGLYYALTAQGVFRASTLILVTHQKVPEGYVRPIVQMTMEEMLQTIQQQVTSRTNLEKIMAEQRVFSEPDRAGLVGEEKIELFRKRIKIDVVRGTAFKISFDYEDPKKSMDVTNQLASNFISENLKIREDHALGTSQFLQDELDVMRKRLEEKEEKIKQYSQRYLGGMPQDLPTNLSTLQRLQTRLDQLNTNLMAAEERRLTLQQQMASEKMMREQMAGSSSGDSFARAEPQDIPTIRRELARLETKYTESHPDVKRLRDMLARLEAEEAESAAASKKGATESAKTGSAGRFSLTGLLEPQLQQVNSEITLLRSEIEKVKAQVEAYEKKVEDTPKREQEMILLTRDYETIKTQYENLSKRKIDADIAVNMERKQKGEQFRLLDPAKLPEKPVSPDFSRTLLLSIALGLCLGAGLAFVAEVLDSSYKNPEEVEGDLKFPVIASLGYRYTEKELRRQKLKGILKAASVAAGFAVCAFCVVVAAKGADKTFEFIRSILGWQM